VEKLELKKKIFQNLETLTRPDTVLATNTSALSVSKLGEGLRNPERVVGMHFFNPVHKMKLVEVVRARHCSQAAVDTAVALARRIGKFPLVVSDSPGFLVNRILLPYLLEAAMLFEQGAKLEDIDTCMSEFGMPMGPLRLLDEVGLDIAADVEETLASAFAATMLKSQVIPQMIQAGLLGKKSGAGFYTYEGGEEHANAGASAFQKPESSVVTLSPDELQHRLVMLLVNEAARCLEERVVETAADVDFGMILGTGFAPFRGGPLRHAETLGISRVVEDLNQMRMQWGARYTPARILVDHAARKESLYEDERSTGRIR
jgi:3-hydroxyacyl-CoA dehydrogenase/enoyl-CoA hydratase/3-hydroxybutyryl-CoA epimerase